MVSLITETQLSEIYADASGKVALAWQLEDLTASEAEVPKQQHSSSRPQLYQQCGTVKAAAAQNHFMLQALYNSIYAVMDVGFIADHPTARPREWLELTPSTG